MNRLLRRFGDLMISYRNLIRKADELHMSSDGGGGGCVMLVLGALALAYCSSNDSERPSYDDPSSEYWSEDEADSEEFESDATGDEESKGDETRPEYEDRQAEIGGDRGTYHGDICTVNCDGHEAGRQWAEERGITDPSDCGGRSWSFQEGCETYATEQQEAEEEY